VCSVFIYYMFFLLLSSWLNHYTFTANCGYKLVTVFLQMSAHYGRLYFVKVYMLQIIDVHDVSSIYRVPIILDDQQMDLLLAKRLELSLPTIRPPRFLLKWKDLADRFAAYFHYRSLFCISEMVCYVLSETVHCSQCFVFSDLSYTAVVITVCYGWLQKID